MVKITLYNRIEIAHSFSQLPKITIYEIKTTMLLNVIVCGDISIFLCRNEKKKQKTTPCLATRDSITKQRRTYASVLCIYYKKNQRNDILS